MEKEREIQKESPERFSNKNYGSPPRASDCYFLEDGKGKDVTDASPLLFVFKDVLTSFLLFFRTQSSSHLLNILNELNFLKKWVTYK